jgi:hypothetical protein
MADELLKDLPRDLPAFLKRFGTDVKCRAYLVRARWPGGFLLHGLRARPGLEPQAAPDRGVHGLRQAALDLAGTIFE